MSKKEKKQAAPESTQQPQSTGETAEAENVRDVQQSEEIKQPEDAAQPEETGQPEEAPAQPEQPQINWEEKYNAEHDVYLRLAAEFDNFRKRTVKEKEQSYGNGKADAVAKILPIYDSLERAMNQPTEDAAYKKGVEMTLGELVKILNGLGVEIFGEVGEEFSAELHNAVMHTEDESLGQNVIAQVFQKGFRQGGKVIRFAMVQVAN